MALKEQIHTLTQKEMNRGEFLKYAGGILLAVVGVTGLLRTILGSQETTRSGSSHSNEPAGYGMSAYGK